MIIRRFIISLLAVLIVQSAAMAVPAWPEVTQARQPDGTTLSIRLHGDEYLHYCTTADGYTIIRNAQGFYVYAEQRDNGELTATEFVAHDVPQRTAKEQLWLQGRTKFLFPLMNKESAHMRAAEAKRRSRILASRRTSARNHAPGYDYNNFRGLILLVEYKDRPFSSTDYADILDKMVNEENYTGYDDTPYGQYSGSVRDYFYENSNHLFTPQFDVVGPIPIDFSQYDANGKSAVDTYKLAQAAITDADLYVDFSKYDGDGDGKVDLVYFIFSGIGAHFGDNDKRLLWPHAYALSPNGKIECDGVEVDRYACSTELLGDEDYSIYDGIGTICHEFSHVLGLPDLYDTDSEESGGASNDPALWSLMASGSHLNYGRTPAGLGLYERWVMGFATPQQITDVGTYQISPVGISNTGYRLNSNVENEFFLMEYRHPIFKWDKYLPGHGMLVYRVDSTATSPWEENKVNADPAHNHYELIRAGGGNGATTSDPFPGSDGVTILGNSTLPGNLLAWSGETTSFELIKIAEYGSVIAFDVVQYEQGMNDDENDENPNAGAYGLKYWFDDQKELAGQIDNYNAAFGLDVSMLSEGLHALHIAVYWQGTTAYHEAGAQTYYFIKQPSKSTNRQTDYTFFVDGEQVEQMTGSIDEVLTANIPMNKLPEGLHLLTTQVRSYGETTTHVTNHYFLRVPMIREMGNYHLACQVDSGVVVTLERGFVGDSLNYELDLKDLQPGLHRLTYQLISGNLRENTPPHTAFFIVNPKIDSYEYWLNHDPTTLRKYTNLKAGSQYEVAAELAVQKMPIRSSIFKFAVEKEQPVVYAVNDLTIRFTDNRGIITDSTVQYVDVNYKEAIAQTTLLEKDEPAKVLAPQENQIKWFRLEAFRGDGILLQTDRPCDIHIYAPDGEEIYHANGDKAKVKAGTNGLQTGTYYVAVHDISDAEDSHEMTVTYYEGNSILTQQPKASLDDGATVYRQTTVTLRCTTQGAVIWYTTDGSGPSLESETTHRYDGKAIAIDGQMVIRAIATCNNMLVSDEVIYHYDTYKTDLRWDFSKRWRWISHNMVDDMDACEFYDFAEYMQSETQTLSIEEGQPIAGSMSPLTATASYKVKAGKPVIVERKLDMIDPSKAMMELHKGWNWIGYPVGHSQTLEEAFGSQAREGDVICGQLGYASFENGQWAGTLKTLDTGRGYLLKSSSSRILTFRDVEDSTTEPQAEPFSGQYGAKVDIYGYPTTMNLTAQLYVDGIRVGDGISVGAFCGDECRGVAEYIDGCYYLTVYGNNNDIITLRAVEAETSDLLDIDGTFCLTQEVYGSRVNPLRLDAAPKSYTLTYIIDGDEYQRVSFRHNDAITPIETPEKEGYTFSGWHDLPETMPAHDVVATGFFTVNTYQVTFMYSDVVLKVDSVEYGSEIPLPDNLDSNRYLLIEWIDVPETMPARDIVIYANYTDRIDAIADDRDYMYFDVNGYRIPRLHRGLNVIRMSDGTMRKVLVK